MSGCAASPRRTARTPVSGVCERVGGQTGVGEGSWPLPWRMGEGPQGWGGGALLLGLTAAWPSSAPGSAAVLVAGGFAGLVSWAVATPLDVIKSRMQMAGLKHTVYRGVLDCMARSVRQEGLGVFFRGLTINSARAFPVNAVTFLSYEYLLRWWG